MDFKGISWAGNIYQKFEDMCLEVEEVMVQDTVKYMENQVQKAGISFKKFYSEVMQDLIPSSCGKEAPDNLSLYPCAYTDINKKPEPISSENWGENKDKATVDRLADESNRWKKYPISGLNDVNRLSGLSSGSEFPLQNPCSEAYSAKGKKVGLSRRRPVGIKRISEKSHLPKGSKPLTLVSADNNILSDVRANADLVSLERCDSEETSHMSTPKLDPPIDSTDGNTNLSFDTLRQKEDDAQNVSCSHDSPFESIVDTVRQREDDAQHIACSHFSSLESIVDNVRQREDDARCILCSHDLSSESIGTSMDGGTGLQVGSNFQSDTKNTDSGCEDVIMADEDNVDMEFIENSELVEPGDHIFNQVTTSKLEETCVLVEGNDFHLIPQGTGKRKSYKKKIREAFASKLRSRKKQQNELCIPQLGHVGVTKSTEFAVPALTSDFEKPKLPAQDYPESDWELL